MPPSPDFLARFHATDEQYRPHLMWFWNAPLREDEVRAQVRGFHEAGINDFYIHPMFGFAVDYLSEEFFTAVGWAIDEAARHGMRFWIYDEYNWPSGAAGCYVFRDHPEHRMTVLERREWQAGEAEPEAPGPEMTRFQETSGKIGAYYEALQDGVCPFAQWSPFCWNQQGYADVSHPPTVERFIELTHEAYYRHFGEHFGKTLVGLFTDEVSYALAGAYGRGDVAIAWSHSLGEDFRARFGYDLTDHLPSLMEDVGDFRRIRHDYWQIMADRLAGNFYQRCADWCQEHGIELTGHVSGEEFFRTALLFFGDIYRCLKPMDVPGIDAIFPRFNHEAEHFMVAPKSGGAVLRHSGRERLLCETYTGSGWELTPLEMKVIFDKLALGGVNLLQYMGAYYSIAGMRKFLPGGYPPSHSFQNAYWEHYRQFGDYVARVCQVMAESRSTARVAVLYPMTTAMCEWSGPIGTFWLTHEGTPRFQGLQMAFLAVTNVLLEASVDYDYLFEDVMAAAEVDGARLRTAHAEYDLLIVPGAPCLPAGVGERLRDYLAAGGAAVLLNHVPEWAADGEAAAEALAQALGMPVAEANVRADEHLVAQAGTVIAAGGPQSWILSADLGRGGYPALAEALLPLLSPHHFAATSLPAGVVATRRDLDGSPVVLLFNRTDQPVSVPRPQGTAAALDPETGELTALGGEVGLAPYQTLIAVADLGATARPPGRAEIGRGEIELGEAEFRLHQPNLWAARWELRLPDGDDWTPLDGLRFPPAHGVAPGHEYELRWRFLVADQTRQVELVTEDLGEAMEITLNGQPVTGFAPARVWDWLNVSADVAAFLHPGDNELVLRSRTPSWDGPHSPPLAALRGMFAVREGALGELVTRLGPGSWAEQGYPNYVGTAEYRWEWDLETVPGAVIAEADHVAHVAALVVNGHRLPARLWPPYRFGISDHLRPGRNELALEVTSASANLLGLSDSERLLSSAEVTAREAPLPAGLLSPLRLRW